LEKFSQGSSYNLTEDAAEAFKNLKLLQFVFLACGFKMSECPSSASAHLVKRLLIFYGRYKYLTEFIDQYDQEAMDECSLIVPYQMLPTPASDVLFTFDKHVKPIYKSVIGGDNDSYLFTISDKILLFNMNRVAECGEIKIEGIHNAPIKQLIVYWNKEPKDNIAGIKEIDGGFITATSNCLWSYSFQNHVYFKINFQDVKISVFRLISAEHLCVSYEGMNYVDIYNLFSGNLVERRKLKEKIKFMVMANKDADNKVLLTTNLESIFLVIAFEMGLISLYRVKLENKIIEMSVYIEFPALSFECTALSWDNINRFIVIATEDGSVLTLDTDWFEDYPGKGLYLKQINDSKQVSMMSICINEYGIESLLIGIGSNGHIYIFFKNLYEIKGSFQHALVISIIKNLIKIAAFSKGTIHYFIINTKIDEQGYYQILKQSEVDIHFDEVTYFFKKGSYINIITY